MRSSSRAFRRRTRPADHDDLYDGIEEGANILPGRGLGSYKVLTEALVEGMRIVARISAAASCSCWKCAAP
jgi:hypothetical protein